MKLYASPEKDLIILEGIKLIGFEIISNEPLHIKYNNTFAVGDLAVIKINKKIEEIKTIMVDLKVDEWHDSDDLSIELAEYLGMTTDEYGDYLLNNNLPEKVSFSLLKDFVKNYHNYKNKSFRFTRKI